MSHPKRDPHTGQFLPSSPRKAALRTAASSMRRALRANPKKRTKTAKPRKAKPKTARKPTARKSSFWGW
jgi:hypothetical protein